MIGGTTFHSGIGFKWGNEQLSLGKEKLDKSKKDLEHVEEKRFELTIKNNSRKFKSLKSFHDAHWKITLGSSSDLIYFLYRFL